MNATPWELYVQERFPGYLLPEACRKSLTSAEAQRFLEMLTGRPDQLRTLRAASTLLSRGEELKAFIEAEMAVAVRNLPARNEAIRREWEGGFHGRLAVTETQFLHTQGLRTSFVTRSPRRTFDLPENVLLRGVCDKLLGALTLLRRSNALPEHGWGASLRETEGCLRRLLSASALRLVPPAPVSAMHEAAGASARDRVFVRAAEWWRILHDGLDSEDPARTAEVVSKGALQPLDAPTRFELAVLIRLVEGLRAAFDRVAADRWVEDRGLVHAGRKDVASFHREGTIVRVFYNQSVLAPGTSDLGCKHYFASTGRLRPDVTVKVEHDGVLLQAVVIEVKHSADMNYLMKGFKEAALYRAEYAAALTGWPKAILVSSGPVPGNLRDDDVIAVGWDQWVPEQVANAIVGRATRDLQPPLSQLPRLDFTAEMVR